MNGLIFFWLFAGVYGWGLTPLNQGKQLFPANVISSDTDCRRFMSKHYHTISQ